MPWKLSAGMSSRFPRCLDLAARQQNEQSGSSDCLSERQRESNNERLDNDMSGGIGERRV